MLQILFLQYNKILIMSCESIKEQSHLVIFTTLFIYVFMYIKELHENSCKLPKLYAIFVLCEWVSVFYVLVPVMSRHCVIVHPWDCVRLSAIVSNSTDFVTSPGYCYLFFVSDLISNIHPLTVSLDNKGEVLYNNFKSRKRIFKT